MDIVLPSQKLSYIPQFIQINIPLHDKNWFKTGGSARYYCEPQSNYEFQQAIQFAHAQNLAIFILGEGANILISDEGFDGLVIRPLLKEITRREYNETYDLIEVASGISFHD